MAAFNAQIFRSKRHIIFQHGSDQLILRILEHYANATPGRTIFVGIRQGIGVGAMPQQRDVAAVGRGQSGNQPGKSRFAGSVRADQTNALAGPNGQ